MKSNGASRNADQRMKDGIIDAGKGTFIDGKNTPNGFAGRRYDLTDSIIEAEANDEI